jgi:DNA-binding PadR family transcriptional regulator
MDKKRLTHVRNMLTEVLLTEIEVQGKIHGYALIKHIRKKLGAYLGPSTVYPALNELEKQGLIVSSWNFSNKRPIRAYSLTLKGKAELESLTQDLKFILRIEAIV